MRTTIGVSLTKIEYKRTFFNKKESEVEESLYNTQLDSNHPPEDNQLENKEISGSQTKHSKKQILQNDSIEETPTLPKKNIYFNNPSYNLSTRLVNDENNVVQSKLKVFYPSREHKFIDKIIEDENKREFISGKKFLSLQDDSVFCLIGFVFDQYSDIMKAHKLIGSKLYLTLINKLSHSVTEFKYKYAEILQLQEFYFQPSLIKKNKFSMNLPILDLVLKAKILNSKELLDRTYEFSLLYHQESSNRHNTKQKNRHIKQQSNQKLIATWKFDIRRKGDIACWFASEAENFSNMIIRHCYSQPIISFAPDDYIQIKINIFSKAGIIIPESIEWTDLLSHEVPKDNFLKYEKNLDRHKVQFDSLRCCELENCVHIWKNEKSLSKTENINEFRYLFNRLFDIYDVSYEVFKFYIYKVTMKAKKVGTVKRNKFCNCDLLVKKKEEEIINETQCLGLLNIGHISNRFELRVGQMVLFYFTDLHYK